MKVVQDAHSCRFCRSDRGTLVMDLGPQPPSELFPPFDAPGPDPVFPLRLWMCGACALAQLADDMDVPEDPQGVQPDALSPASRRSCPVTGRSPSSRARTGAAGCRSCASGDS